MEGETGDETAKVWLVEQLTEVEIVCLQLTLEVLLTVHRATQVDSTCTRKDGTVQRDKTVVVFVEGAEHLKSVEPSYL